MAARKTSFVDQHIEKVAIGAGAALLIGVLCYALLSDRFVVGTDVTPAQLITALKQEAEGTARQVQNAQPKPEEGPSDIADDPVEKLAQWYGEGAPGLIGIAGIPKEASRAQPFPPPFVSATEISAENRHDIARFVAPGIPIVSSGKTTFDIPEDKPELSGYDGRGQSGDSQETKLHWVTVAAQVDLHEQAINFDTAGYPSGAFPDIVRVHLQRFDEVEPWRGWQDVDTYLPFKPFARPEPQPSGLNLQEVFEFGQMIAESQEQIARPQLPARVSGDRLRPPPIPYNPDAPRPDDDTARLARGWLQDAKDAKKPGKEQDLDAALILLRAVVGASGARDQDVREARQLLDDVKKQLGQDKDRKNWIARNDIHPPQRLMPIVAHDIDVVPGHTYQYRLRYEAYNLYAGNAGELNNREDAGSLTVSSDWSLPTRPVTIESDLRFFLTDKDERKGQVKVTVHKKSRSGWKNADFTIKVGDPIGGKKTKGKDQGDYSTSAVCVEIDFNRRNGRKKDVILVYVDTNTGRLGELSLSAGEIDSRKLASAG